VACDVIGNASGSQCILNAANAAFNHAGGVAQAIAAAAGDEWVRQNNDYIRQSGPVEVGRAVLMGPGLLQQHGVKHIINAVAPQWAGENAGEDELLYHAYLQALELADRAHCSSLTLLALGAGIYNVPVELSLHMLLLGVLQFFSSNPQHCRTLHLLDRDAARALAIETQMIKLALLPLASNTAGLQAHDAALQ
jgi:O-acetyl-ADP-ribose deacetylase (regulator of RNase III)